MPRARTIGCIAFAFAVALLGGTGLLLATRIWRGFSGPQFGSDGPQSAWTASWAGDVDLDGVSDILLSTPFEHVGDNVYGSARIFCGARGNCLRSVPRVFKQQFSWDVMSPAGDVDGDGRDDLFVHQLSGSRVIDIATGRTLLEFPYGNAVSFTPLGDVDGDGADDLLARTESRTDNDLIRLSAFSSRTGADLWSIEGRDELHNRIPRPFAWHRRLVGDVNHDGVVDIAIDTDRDRVRLISGHDGSTLKEFDFEFEWMGTFEPASDLDRDGLPDLLVRSSNDGVIRAVSCATGNDIWTIPSERFHSRTPHAIGDMDGDGISDVALSDWGSLSIHSGVDGRGLWIIEDVCFGGGVADFNHDGRNDLLVTRNVDGESAERLGDDVWRAGRVEVLSGRDRSVLFALDGDDLTPINR